MSVSRRVLVVGYGNPGRLDDGLGPAAAAALESLDLEGVTIETDFQLQPELAATFADHDGVVFVDAHTSCAEPFEFSPVEPAPQAGLTTHTVSPGAVVRLAREHFGARPRAFALGIRGYRFDGFGEELSRRARANLEAATGFLEDLLRRGVEQWQSHVR